MKKRGLTTELVHAGEHYVNDAIVTPIFQSSTYLQGDQTEYDAIRYVRCNNSPNHIFLGEKVAAVEQSEAALVTGSGMAAITTILMEVASPGDHLLVQRGIYGGTYAFMRDTFNKFGIEWTEIDGADPESWVSELRSNTVAIYVETISNPTLFVPALASVVEFANDFQLTSIIDNTFASPANFKPVPFGFDVSLQSATKYMNGHSDIAAGTIASTQERIKRFTHALNHWGGVLDPHACFLLQRGMKTLDLRVTRQNETAMALAELLQAHARVAVVNYPGLTSHPQHATAADTFVGFGGMLSFRPNGPTASDLIARLELALCAPSLGGVETLVITPATSSHAGLSKEERESIGIDDNLVRVSVGIEDTEDVLADFTRALNV